MAGPELPPQASLEYLKKVAKERLRALRRTDPDAKLATVQLAMARELGFPSWRALKARVDAQSAPLLQQFFEACQAGDVEALRALLDKDPALANARDEGDNALGLHFAAARGHLGTVRALLDAGSDVHGFGDVHGGDVIGWATSYGGDKAREVVALLLSRGAQHHIFSAISMGDADLVRAVVARDPQALSRRRSRFEDHQTALHFALAAPNATGPKQAQFDMAAVLIELGADLDAEDDKGRTPLAVAMMRGDLDAMRFLKAAGAREPQPADTSKTEAEMDALRQSSYRQATPMLCVADPDAAVAWYQSLGFELKERIPPTGGIGWARMTFGKTDLMFQARGSRKGNQVALWFHTSRIDELYQMYKSRQLKAAQAALRGEADDARAIEFTEDLYSPPYGGRQFSVQDINGLELVFQSE